MHPLELIEPTAPAAMGRRMAQPVDAQALLSQLGGEVAAQLSSALERVTTLAATGKIDRAGLRALRDEIDHARRAGIMGQQLVRLSSGRVELSDERLDLTGLLRDALHQRSREIESRGFEVRQLLAAATVVSDSTLVFSLLQTLLDWCFEHAFGRIDLSVEVKNWPAHARLIAAFQHEPPDKVEAPIGKPVTLHETRLDTMSWRLLQQTAGVLGLELARGDSPGRTYLTLEFPLTVVPRLVDAEAAAQRRGAGGKGHHPQPAAGRHVVLLAARREVRNLLRTALQPMGLVLDSVASVQDLRQLVATGLPDAVVYEAAMASEAFARLQAEWLAERPALAFIRIADQEKTFEASNTGGRQVTSVSLDAIMVALPQALALELSRTEAPAARGS